MTHLKKLVKKRPALYRSFVTTALLASSLFQFVTPVLAEGTAAGEQIKNTATATFKDDSGTSYNATSNAVVITVAEIAGITITSQAPNASPNAGDTIYVEYTITNTGNDPTQFFIPGTATLNTSTPGAFSQNGQIQIVEVNGTSITPVNVPANGATTATLLSNPTIPAYPGTGSTGTIKVRVPIQVSPTANSGNTLTVSLGNTDPAKTQNQPLTTTPTQNELYTVDNANGVGGENNTTSPVNGTREAMGVSPTITVNARQQAFAAILKAVSSYNNNSTPNVLTDDLLTYGLALRVENPTTPPAGLVASDLYGTEINVDSSTSTKYVLVSDAIPAGMQLTNTTPVAPQGWVPVYTTDALNINPLQAKWTKWTTSPPTSGVTRVGFVYDTSTNNTPISRGQVGVGNTISGFSFVVTPQQNFTGGQVANIAQVFGQSQPGPVVPGTSTQIVYDESGDQATNNQLGGNNPDPNTQDGTPEANGGISNGVADPSKDGTDPGTGNNPTNTTNTNQGSTTDTDGGENTVFTIAATPLNGPDGKPGAVGPTNNNDDFTNKSIQPPAGLDSNTPLTDAQTPPVTFNNTVENTSGTSQEISLLPTKPTNPTDLLKDTLVTITDPASGNTATYKYDPATGFTLDSGTPVKITIPVEGTANYTVKVDLPEGTPQLQGFPVPITAFVDTNKDGSPDGDPSNTTIDRVYTGYLKLVKEARLLESNGTPVSGAAGQFTTNQTDLSAAATPGRMIEYRITYQNISSTAGSGTGNVILPAKELEIKEDGNNGTNTWFNLTTDPQYPTGSGVDPNPNASITVTDTNGNIQIYTDKVTVVNPGESGQFSFKRTIK